MLGGGSDGCLYLYDVSADQRVVRVPAHGDDVNAVCWGEGSGNVIYSGSDDATCKVWDRRTLGGGEGKAVGVMVGHLDGITYIDSKDDGRYFISNSKDQSIKLWDVRKMKGQSDSATRLSLYGWDYRYDQHLSFSSQNLIFGFVICGDMGEWMDGWVNG